VKGPYLKPELPNGFLTYVWIRSHNSFRQRTGGPGFDSQTICLVTVFRAALGLIGASRWCKGSYREAEYWPISSPKFRAPHPAYIRLHGVVSKSGRDNLCVSEYCRAYSCHLATCWGQRSHGCGQEVPELGACQAGSPVLYTRQRASRTWPPTP